MRLVRGSNGVSVKLGEVRRSATRARDSRRIGTTLAYAFVTVARIIFGSAGLLSIGASFRLTGLVMLICFPRQRRREVLWPVIAGVWGFGPGGTSPPLGALALGDPNGL